MLAPGSDEDDELFFSPPKSTGLLHLQENSSFFSPTTGRSLSLDTKEQTFCSTINQQNHSDFPLGKDISYEREQLIDEGQLSRGRVQRQGSIVDGLLHEIYDRWHYGRHDSIDSDTLTECSSTSEFFFHGRHDSCGYHSATEKRHAGHLNRTFLQNQSQGQLEKLLAELQHSVAVMNVRLVKQLKRRDRCLARLQRNCDIVTAVLQAASLKRQIDTRMKFSIQPPPGQSAFEQWRDAMKAVCRLPMGVPPEFRKKVWLSLADHYLHQLKINWENTVRFVFNERSNPDDEQLGMQIVKDLHRTGCSNFSGDDNDEDRAVLKRLLLAYARWNKRVGYCQGFNVIAALLLNVMDHKEDDALKVMIYLIDSVLPESYFANNLRALSVDMAVFRDLLRLTYPKLSKHLDRLQVQAQDIRTGACYEPPLTNVFTMQWFLTLFATCLPVNIVLRVWDSIMLEGSEILLRTALTIWGKLAKRIMGASSADEFYCLMGELSSGMMQGYIFDGDTMIKSIYLLGDFPFPHLNELREKYTYNIRPLSQASSSSDKKTESRGGMKSLVNSDEDDLDDDDIAAMACMPGDVNSPADISVLGPGVYGPGNNDVIPKGSLQLERMTTDIQSLKLQYEKLKQRQRQAHIIIAAASAKKAKPASAYRIGMLDSALVPNIELPSTMNHLFVGKGLAAGHRNRLVREGPRIAAPEPVKQNSSVLAKQVQAVANAQAVSKYQRMRTGLSAKSVIYNPVAAITSSQSSSTTAKPFSEVNSSSCSSRELSPTKQSAASSPSCVSESLSEPKADTLAKPNEIVKCLKNTTDSNSLSSRLADSYEDIPVSTETLPTATAADEANEQNFHPSLGTSGIESPVVSQELDSEEIINELKIDDALPFSEISENLDALGVDQCHSEDTGEVLEDVTLYPLTLTEIMATENSSDGLITESEILKDLPKDCEQKAKERINSDAVEIDDNENVKGSQAEGGEQPTCSTHGESDELGNSEVSLTDIEREIRSDSDTSSAILPVIETIPIPKMVALTFDEPGAVTHHHRVRKNSSSRQDSRSAHNAKVFPQSNFTLPAKNHQRSRRFSSPARAETMTNSKLSLGCSASLMRKNSIPFNPFPVKQLNANRVKTGLKLGLYKPSTLEQYGVHKSSTTS